MFRKKALLVKVVDAKDTDQTETDSEPQNSPEAIAIEVIQEVKKAAIAVIAFACFASTAREVAIHAAKTNLKQIS